MNSSHNPPAYGLLPRQGEYDSPDFDYFGYEPRGRVLHVAYVEQVEKVGKQACCGATVICCWLPGINCCFGACAHYGASQKAGATALIITEREVVLHIRAHQNVLCCSCCCTAGSVTVTVPYEQITDVRVSTPGTGCCNMFATPTLCVETANNKVGQDGKAEPEIKVIGLLNPLQVRTIILDGRDALLRERHGMGGAGPSSGQYTAPPITQQPHPSKSDADMIFQLQRRRLLVSKAGDTKTRIVVVNASDEWAAVCAVCAEKVGVDASRPLSLSLDNGAELSDTLELNDNDHVIVTPIN